MISDVAQHKSRLQDYFDGIGFERWSAIYGVQQLSPIRTSIRVGHTRMLQVADQWLTESCAPGTLLDAGCGVGLFSLAMAQRGFDVTAVDIAPRMVAAARASAAEAGLKIQCVVGDVEDATGPFDAVACFDVLVHYPHRSFVHLVTHLSDLTKGPLLFTYAPHSRAYAAMHWLGGFFPKGHRRTEIQMIPDAVVAATLARVGRRIRRTAVISQGFYHVMLAQADRVE